MSWMIDPSHTRVQFSTRHMMISTVRGEFKDFGGTVEFDETKPEATKVAVSAHRFADGSASTDPNTSQPEAE